MSEFWEQNFIEKQEMWGFEPASSAVITKDLFLEHGVENVLIPGIGYGRNAKVFLDAGMQVTGIEISETAIQLARKHFGGRLIIHLGSVTNMPFDKEKYEGIFCHALIHLLDTDERAKFLEDCYAQLVQNGYMAFTALSKEAPSYGKGDLISEDRYEFFKGVKTYHYDRESIHKEFGRYNISDIHKVDEHQPMYLVLCKK